MSSGLILKSSSSSSSRSFECNRDKVIKNLDEEKKLMKILITLRGERVEWFAYLRTVLYIPTPGLTKFVLSINHHYWDGQEQVMLLTQLQKYQQINIVNFNHKIISFSSKYELQRLKNQCNKLNQNLIQVPYLYCISWFGYSMP